MFLIISMSIGYSSDALFSKVDVPRVGVSDEDFSETGVTRYVYGAGLVASIKSGEISYYHSDRMKSARLISGSYGGVEGEFKSLPFGQEVKNSGVRYAFATNKELDESDLYYFNARYYDPNLGRFSSVDPVQSEPAYQYVWNNPLSFVDPSGAINVKINMGYSPSMMTGDPEARIGITIMGSRPKNFEEQREESIGRVRVENYRNQERFQEELFFSCKSTSSFSNEPFKLFFLDVPSSDSLNEYDPLMNLYKFSIYGATYYSKTPIEQSYTLLQLVSGDHPDELIPSVVPPGVEPLPGQRLVSTLEMRSLGYNSESGKVEQMPGQSSWSFSKEDAFVPSNTPGLRDALERRRQEIQAAEDLRNALDKVSKLQEFSDK